MASYMEVQRNSMLYPKDREPFHPSQIICSFVSHAVYMRSISPGLLYPDEMGAVEGTWRKNEKERKKVWRTKSKKKPKNIRHSALQRKFLLRALRMPLNQPPRYSVAIFLTGLAFVSLDFHVPFPVTECEDVPCPGLRPC